MRPICATAHGRVSVSGSCDDININAASFHAGVLFPEIRHRPTLENKDEKEVSTHNPRRSHDEPESGSLNRRYA